MLLLLLLLRLLSHQHTLNKKGKQISSNWYAGTWVTPDAVLAHATAQSSTLTPRLVGRYPARTPIKDKEWPAIIEKALRAVQDSKALQGYDVVPSMLTDQYDLIGWLQVLTPHMLSVCTNFCEQCQTPFERAAIVFALFSRVSKTGTVY
jgi:hypothetical protein